MGENIKKVSVNAVVIVLYRIKMETQRACYLDN